jgi:integrase
MEEILNAMPKVEGNEYVFAGRREGQRLVGIQRIWRRVAKAAKLDDVRIHDLRHSLASVGAAGGLSLPIIGKLLGHSQPQTTARYAHLAADPVKAAAETVAKRVAGMMAGHSAKVVPLKRKRRA